jgi:hypothetical protein
VKTEFFPTGRSVRIAGYENTVWEIELPHRPPVFMSFVKTDVYQPIFIGSTLLLDLWKREPANHGKGLAFGNQTSWRSYLKFDCAERGFASGQSNPVPLPTLLIEVVREIVTASVEGQTRTIWLLANGCALLPMQCKPQDAEILRRLSNCIFRSS